MQLHQRLPNQSWQKISEEGVVYFQLEDNHETIAESEKVKKNYRFKHELKMTFLFNFLR